MASYEVTTIEVLQEQIADYRDKYREALNQISDLKGLYFRAIEELKRLQSTKLNSLIDEFIRMKLK